MIDWTELSEILLVGINYLNASIYDIEHQSILEVALFFEKFDLLLLLLLHIAIVGLNDCPVLSAPIKNHVARDVVADVAIVSLDLLIFRLVVFILSIKYDDVFKLQVVLSVNYIKIILKTWNLEVLLCELSWFGRQLNEPLLRSKRILKGFDVATTSRSNTLECSYSQPVCPLSLDIHNQLVQWINIDIPLLFESQGVSIWPGGLDKVNGII